METREFKNEYADFAGESPFDEDEQKLDNDFTLLLTEEVDAMLNKLYVGLEEWLDFDDYTVYTGTTGIALLHLHLHNTLEDQRDQFLKKALTYVEKPLDELERRRVTFLCGDAGPLAVAAVIYKKLEMEAQCQKCLTRLFSRQHDVIKDSSLPNELLFGRVGYLYALLYIRANLGKQTVKQELIDEVYDEIIKAGKKKATKEKWPCPLMFDWHDKVYLGSAHGVMGILHVLLQVNDPKYKKIQDEMIKPTIDHMITLKFASGNFPSSIGSSSGDKLVHWCHGAPGWIHVFLKAHQIFGDKKYMDEAVSCGEVLWKRGLLKKGYGLCHGVAGNAYGLLALFKATKDQKYMYRAWKFAEWCFNYGSHGCRTPDRPMSLFEGMAGTIYLLCDLFDPLEAKFPAFDL